MLKFNNPRGYSLTVGLFLFLLGFLGFAFQGIFDLPNQYLFISLILGFWGIVVGVGGKKNSV